MFAFKSKFTHSVCAFKHFLYVYILTSLTERIWTFRQWGEWDTFAYRAPMISIFFLGSFSPKLGQQCDSIFLKIIFPFGQDYLPPESCCYDDQVDAVATIYLIYFGFWPNWNIGIWSVWKRLQSLLSRPSWLQIFNDRLSISWRSMLTSVQFNNCCNQIACNRSDHQ